MSPGSDQVFTQRIQRPLQQLVQVRRRVNWATAGLPAPSAGGPINGEPGGWETDPNLRCDGITNQVGASVGTAKFTYIARVEQGDSPEFQKQIERYSIDDQVRVFVFPPEDPGALTQDNSEEETDDAGPQGRIMFHGVLMRPQVSVQADATSANETLTFTAISMAALDNMLDEHQVVGRAVIDTTDTENPVVRQLETASLPSVFNYRGRPNRHVTKQLDSAGNPGVSFWGFTDDNDSWGVSWTLRDAITHIVGVYLFGAHDRALKRNMDLHPDLMDALNTEGPSSNNRYDRDGKSLLDVELPEVSIHGMGVLEALEKVCTAVGFRLGVECDDTPAAINDVIADRLYVVNIWRRNGGPLVTLDLASRGSNYSGDASAFLADNNVSKLQLMRDGAQLVNQVSARGQTYVECRIDLVPMWNDSEWPDLSYDNMQDKPTSEDLQTDPYFSKYVSGGLYFEKNGDYGRIGRVWGVSAAGRDKGYNAGVYAQSDEGFYWTSELGLLNSSKLPQKDRVAANVTDELYWMNRIRRLLPLGSTEALALGKQYIVEISENEGTTWQVVPVGVQSMQNESAIKLDVANLATVNSQSIITGDSYYEPESVDKSWYGLIDSQKLRVRVTCTVEADHVIRYDAKQSQQGASVYPRTMIIPLPIDELLVQPNTPFNSSDEWERRYGYGSSVTATRSVEDIKNVATRRRDALEVAQFTGVADIGLMDLTRYNLGDQIARLRGREFSFAVGSSTDTSYPTISSITYTLGSKPGIQLQLDDQRMTRGASPWQL